MAAAKAAGMTNNANCTLALGTPSTRWGEAAVAGIQALGELQAGTLTLSNADVTLVAVEGTSKTVFDRAIGDLEAKLPDVFSLDAVLPVSEKADSESNGTAPEFIAIRSPEGQLQLRGRLGDSGSQSAVESYAAAKFGADNIFPATQVDLNVPAGWPIRVLTALEALSLLHNGVVEVTADKISLSGKTGREDANDEIE